MLINGKLFLFFVAVLVGTESMVGAIKRTDNTGSVVGSAVNEINIVAPHDHQSPGIVQTTWQSKWCEFKHFVIGIRKKLACVGVCVGIGYLALLYIRHNHRLHNWLIMERYRLSEQQDALRRDVDRLNDNIPNAVNILFDRVTTIGREQENLRHRLDNIVNGPGFNEQQVQQLNGNFHLLTTMIQGLRVRSAGRPLTGHEAAATRFADEYCSVCHNEWKDIPLAWQAASCEHVFCSPCLENLMLSSEGPVTCPKCRASWSVI